MTNTWWMGRWERTHEALSQAALELFTAQGFDATGAAQIAERAGVSEMTLFRHFPSKEALLLDDPFDPLMADAVRQRPADEPPMRAVAEGIRQAWSGVDADSADALRARLHIIADSKTLQGALERNSARTVEALTAALVDRGATPADARVAAAAVIAGLSEALLEWARSGQPLDRALTVLGGA